MSKEAMKLALEALRKARQKILTTEECHAAITFLNKALEEALAKQEQGEPVENRFVRELREYGKTNQGAYLFPSWDIHRALKYLHGYTTPQQRKPQFKEFIKWAGSQGYDCAQTCNSDTGEWIVLNPMTADLWKAWQAAHGIKE